MRRQMLDAVGKVMLAFGGSPPPRERDLLALTDRTITDRAELASEVMEVRERVTPGAARRAAGPPR